MRLRTRFTAAGGAAIALLAVAVVPGIVDGTRVEAADQVDARLSAVDRVATPVLVATGAARAAGAAGAAPAAGTGDVGVLLLDADGGARRSGPLPAALPDPTTPGFATITQDGARWRVLTVTVDARLRADDDAPVVVQYATSLAEADRRTERTRWAVVLGFAVGVVLAGLLSWLVGGWAARPLRRLREATGRLRDGERVPADQRVDDVDDLARTVNALLDRVDAERDRSAAALAASRAFAAAAAHELRTPLTSISTNLDVLEAYPDLPAADRATVLREQRTALDRVLGLLTGLRELARGDARAGTPVPAEETDLAELADEVVQDARRRHPGAEVVLDAPERLPFRGWRDGLWLLLDNLVGNGLVHGRPPVAVTVRAEAGGVRLTVDDAGPGIPPADRRRVLERFVRGATRAPGLGLGLALAAQQAELHGGELAISDAPAGGARVTVHLPATAPGPPGPDR